MLAEQPAGGVDHADGEVVGLHGAQHAALGAGAGEHEQLGPGVDPLGGERDGDPAVAAQHAEPGPLGGEPVAVDGEVAVAEEREVPVGEPAQQVRDVVRAGDLRGVRGAVGVEQAVGEQPVGQRAGLAGHGRGVADDLADVVQHPRHVRVQAGGGRAAEVDVDPRLGDRPGGRGGRVGVGQDRLQFTVRCAFDDDDGMDHPPGLAAGPADRGEDRFDQVGHVVGDDLEDRSGLLARGLVAQADQLLPGGPVPGELAVRAGGGAQDRAGVAGAEVGSVAAVERVEAGVDRIGRGRDPEISGVGVGRRLRGGGLLTGPTDHVRAPRGSWLVLASAGLATSRVARVVRPTRRCAGARTGLATTLGPASDAAVGGECAGQQVADAEAVGVGGGGAAGAGGCAGRPHPGCARPGAGGGPSARPRAEA